MSTALATLLVLAGSVADPAPTFEIRLPEPPPTPFRTRRARVPPRAMHHCRVEWTPPAGVRRGRECPTCGRIFRRERLDCQGVLGAWHAVVKTRKVVLGAHGKPVRKSRKGRRR